MSFEKSFLTHHEIDEERHGDNQEIVQIGEQVPLGRQDREEVAAKSKARQVGHYQ